MAGDRVARAVVDRVLDAGRLRQRGLLVAAHRADHGGAGPPRELDGRVADRACSAGDEHGQAGQRTGGEPIGAVLGGGQRTVGGDRGHTERGAHVIRRRIGQHGDVADWQHDQLLGRTPGTGVLSEHRPNPVADLDADHADADGVDHAGAVLAGHDLGKRGSPTTPARNFQSVGLTPARTIRTRTSPGPGSAISRSTSSSTDGPPHWV